jgi:hypothetical protein
MKTVLLGIISIVLLVGAVRADDKLTLQSAELKQLLGEVQKVLPEGWHAALTPEVPETIACEFRQPTASGLMIWRDDRAIGRYVGLKLAPGSMDAEFQPQRVFFQLCSMDQITPEQYRVAAERNASNDAKRHEFQHKLKDAGIKNSLAFVIKDDEPPLAPSTYKPQTPEQNELIRQYASLWVQTEPQALPTCYYRTLAFNADFDEHFMLQDGDLDSERQEVKKAILKIVTAYSREPASAGSP